MFLLCNEWQVNTSWRLSDEIWHYSRVPLTTYSYEWGVNGDCVQISLDWPTAFSDGVYGWDIWGGGGVTGTYC